jgi:polyisoprenoid-binding protein YceI
MWIRKILGGLLGLSLAACQLGMPQPEAPTGPMVLPELVTVGAARYRIDPASSFIHLKVYRDGPLAKLGHNHVIAATQLQGMVYRQPKLSDSRFELIIPVAAMAVDRPADRRVAGPDFAGELRQEYIDGTRRNLLGPDLLQADRHPTIVMRSVAMSGRLPEVIWTVRVQVRGVVSELRLPALMSLASDRIVVQGAVTLSQQQLGLTPFSVMGGKLRVRDTIDAEFHLVARPAN